MVQEGKTLDESIAHCKGMGRELVSILTEEDANHFANITYGIDTSSVYSGYIRVGLHARWGDCEWSWISGMEPFNSGNRFWSPGQPDGCYANEL